MAIENLTLPFLSIPINSTCYTQWQGSVADTRTLMSTLNTNILDQTSAGEHVIYNNGLLKISVTTRLSNNDPTNLVNLDITNVQTNQGISYNNPNYQWSAYLAIGYDIEAHKAYYFMVGQFYYNGNWEEKNYGELDKSDVVDAVIGTALLDNWINYKTPLFTTGDINASSSFINRTTFSEASSLSNYTYIKSFTGTELASHNTDSYYYLFGDSSNGLRLRRNGSNSFAYIEMMYGGSVVDGGTGGMGYAYTLDENHEFSFYLAINDTTQRGTFLVIDKGYGSYYLRDCKYSNIVNNASVYNVIKAMPEPVSYDWSSVSSVTGKKGLFLFSTIKDNCINGGNEVTGATAGNFNRLSETTKLSTLLEGVSN